MSDRNEKTAVKATLSHSQALSLISGKTLTITIPPGATELRLTALQYSVHPVEEERLTVESVFDKAEQRILRWADKMFGS